MNRNATATILIAMSLGIYFTFTSGLIDQAKAVQSVNSDYSKASDNADKLIKVRDEVLKSSKNISDDDSTRLKKMIPDTVDNIRLVIDLDSVASRHGFSLKNVKASSPTAKPASAPPAASRLANSPGVANTPNISDATLDSITVSFSVTGPYLEFISFLQDIEANLRLMDLTHLQLSVDDTGVYTYQVELKTYWLRQQ